MSKLEIVLASSSKIRRDIISNYDVDVILCDPEINEEQLKQDNLNLNPRSLAALLAKSKALSLADKFSEKFILGCDQICIFNDKIMSKEEYFFKHDENHIYATAYKRVNGQFRKVGNVVGQKVSSFLLFEDMTIDKSLNFAWHLDMVTKNLKPFILTLDDKNKFEMPEKYDCISKNFWF